MAVRKDVAIVFPAEEDPLYKFLIKVKPKDLKQLNGVLNLKLKTR